VSNRPPSQNSLRDRFPELGEMRGRYAEAFIGNRRDEVRAYLLIAALLSLYIFGLYYVGFTPMMLINGFGKFGIVVKAMMPPDPGSWENAIVFMRGVVETLAMAFFGTICAACLALPFGFLAARNIVSNAVIHHAVRRFLDIIRGIDTLVWALIWVGVVGLGPFAGVLAIITSDFGAFGKLFSEAIEAADQKPVEGIVASGGSRLESIRFGIIPQILPVLLGQVLYFFESNTRTTTIIGIVGAGGIGLYLTETIRTYLWEETSFIIMLVLITVAAMDFISSKLRVAIIGSRPV
jgi:phosphonate transport system permease protein